MKRNKIKYDRWLRMLFLSFALLIGGGLTVWGQNDRPVISLTWDNEKHDNVHTEEKIIYVDPEKPRVLSIPELNINNRGYVKNAGYDNSYNWFVHWYVKNGNEKGKGTIKHQEITRYRYSDGSWTVTDRGGSLGVINGGGNPDNQWDTKTPAYYTTKDYFVKVNETQGLIWSNRLKVEKIIPPQENVPSRLSNIVLDPNDLFKYGLGIDASTIAYTLPGNYTDGDIVYCDVSTYMDGSWTPTQETSPSIKGRYTEPTLLKRYKFVIKKAEESPSYYQKDKDLVIYEINYPKNASSINLSMPYAPDNYFWEHNGSIHQGSKFEYQINGKGWIGFRLLTKDAILELQQTQKIEKKDLYSDKENIVLIRVICANHSGEATSPVVKYILNPIDNAEFMLEKDLTKDENDDRWPRGNSKKYEQIGIVSFDQDEVVVEINQGYNMSNSPLGSIDTDQKTTYGFIRKDGKSLLDSNNKCYTSYPGMYGLFRSANGTWSKSGEPGFESRYYKWVPIIADKTTFYKQKDPLYDRTYHVEGKHGYFYYIDATDEPGVLVSMPINGTLCANTELTVTGWLADMTRPGCNSEDSKALPLAPNLNVLLKGVNAKNEEILIHWFTTGDALTDYRTSASSTAPKADITTLAGRTNAFNINLMQWQQFHYKFVIPEEKLEGCIPDKFFLEVQNNEPHTDGADYAIDDIRIFKRKPEVEIVQAGDLCDTDLKTVKYGTSYSNIMRVMGLTEDTKVEGINKDVEWNETLPKELRDYISTKYPGAEEDAVQYFTKIYYSVYEENNLESPILIDYDGDGKKEFCRVSYLSTRIEDMTWVDPLINDKRKNLADKIYSLPLEIGEYFDPSKKYIARISAQPIGSHGVPTQCDDCALIGDPFSISVTGKRFTIFGGDDLKTEISSPESVTQGETYTIAGNFRYLDGEWKTLDNAKFDWFIGDVVEFNTKTVEVSGHTYTIAEALKLYSTDPDNSNKIKEALIAYGKEYNKDKNKDGKFVFGVSSFDYEMANKYQTIIGLPQALQKDSDNNPIDKNLYCPDPVVIQLGPTPPTIEPGDPDVPNPEDPDDPKDPEDPDNPDQPDDLGGKHVRSVRVGLVQIQDMQANNGTLRIPIHMRQSDTGETFAKATKTDITVLKTSDKDYKNSDPVATLEDLVDNATAAAWATNYFKIKFTQNAVNHFKEGFWYMVDIPYAVKKGESSITYTGSFQLTLKIVPEYVTWVGSADKMHNWNNDGPNHWRRSNDAELYTTDVANKNGTHNEAYTPMRFTKVTIAGNNDTAYAAYPHLYKLSKRTTDPKALLDMAPANMDATIGAATKNIEYDLLADPDYERELFGSVTNPDKKDAGNNHNYSCVRFYGNTCDEIYIKPESEILHTEFLTYNKAHVDYEMSPNRWYMLASPLKGVVSGDMYLPKMTGNVNQKARQETPAFTDINYSGDYTRWNPAVYMRGWDKSSVKVVRPGENTSFTYGTVANWSNLYNDVNVLFTPGTGFSIGTKANLGDNENVLFRLPKADAKYSYFGSGDVLGEDGDETSIDRTDNGRFLISPDKQGQKAVTRCEVSATGGMFGNPFMSHLDMTKFLDGKSQKTYYIMTATGTTSNILGDGYSISTGDADPKYVAPLQSFIVEGLERVEFTTNMIAKAPEARQVGLRSATTAPAEEPLPQLRITATRDGVRNTAVVAGLVTASDSYVEGEDAALLINEEVAAPQVYTLAGNQMTAINVTPDLNEIPLGIYGKDANPVELSFKVSGAMKNVKLVDKQTGKHYDVSDGLTLTVPGNTSGRYFLNGSIATSNEIIAQGRIIFYNSAPGRIDISSVNPLNEVTVYDIAGRALRTLRNLNTPTASVDHLAPGIYVVRAESGSQTVSEKVEVK